MAGFPLAIRPPVRRLQWARSASPAAALAQFEGGGGPSVGGGAFYEPASLQACSSRAKWRRPSFAPQLALQAAAPRRQRRAPGSSLDGAALGAALGASQPDRPSRYEPGLTDHQQNGAEADGRST